MRGLFLFMPCRVVSMIRVIPVHMLPFGVDIDLITVAEVVYHPPINIQVHHPPLVIHTGITMVRTHDYYMKIIILLRRMIRANTSNFYFYYLNAIFL